MKIVGVHGFNVKDKGARTIDALGHSLVDAIPGSNYDGDNADYGWCGLWCVRFRSKPAVKRIAEAIHKADVVITHSNGANYTMKALKLLKEQGRENPNLHIIHYSPALNRKQPLHRYKFKEMSVFYSPTDWVVKLSRWLPFHSWGDAGAVGIKPGQPRLNNYRFDGVHHSDWFTELSLPTLTKFTVDIL